MWIHLFSVEALRVDMEIVISLLTRHSTQWEAFTMFVRRKPEENAKRRKIIQTPGQVNAVKTRETWWPLSNLLTFHVFLPHRSTQSSTYSKMIKYECNSEDQRSDV